ncbi:hypothetical protein FGB62_207g012 [Gracilaria domingensis]|nr:hypothetical protein FGB62_207g012 [Gracilaria domingensis]
MSFIFIFFLSLLAISAAAPVRQAATLGALGAFFGGGEFSTPSSPEGSTGGDGTGTGISAVFGDGTTFIGGLSPGSGIFGGGTGSSVSADGVVLGLGIGGDASGRKMTGTALKAELRFMGIDLSGPHTCGQMEPAMAVVYHRIASA